MRDHLVQELEGIAEKYGLREALSKVNAASPYIIETLNQQKEKFEDYLSSETWSLQQSLSESDLRLYVDNVHYLDLAEAQFKSLLRRFRNFTSARILWQELNGNLDWQALFRLQSELADVCVQVVLQYVETQFEKQYQKPIDSDGMTLQLCVVAMGKWGGQELNFSSDIDYIYVYAEKGEVEKLAGTRSLTHQQYFTKQAQKINQLLDDMTADGFVYRCDTRLRPFGDSGPLVVSLSALEQYLFEHGREWERYAYLKARCITGDQRAKTEFEQLRRPFVYRRYLDYGVFANLREMHAQISEQVKKKQIKDDIKLGRGGIRECEFLVQAFQLIRGGREPDLQQTNFYSAYFQLLKSNILNDEDERFLQAYIFHRLLENRLQGLHQEQTHQLPSSREDHSCLVQAMGMQDWSSLLQAWEQHRQVVAQRFEQQARLFRLDHTEEEVAYVVLLDAELEQLQIKFSEAGIEPSAHASNFKQGRFYKHLHDKRKRLIDQLLYAYFQYLNSQIDTGLIDIEAVEDIDKRFLHIINSIGRRQTYISLLLEHPMALQNLVSLCAKSVFVCEQIVLQPMLLDELLDARIFQQVPNMEDIRSEVLGLQTRLKDIELETLVHDLITLKNIMIFRIALADVNGKLSLMKVSDCLTVLAESILAVVLDYASQKASVKFKVPEFDWREIGFTVIAYGKLGGLELSYSSDLDIVFLYDEEQLSDAHPLAKHKTILGQIFHRLAQQCIRILDMPTLSGRLYEVDTRLRPSGHSGFLVSSFSAFTRYQEQEAWVWEHQALTRSRPILGSDVSIRNFSTSRKRVLTQYVKRSELRDRVIEMRAKMRQELDNLADRSLFHLKHSQGGMIDIEFLVQYLVLAHAHKYPQLVQYSDNVRQLEAIGTIPDAVSSLPERLEIAELTRIYLYLRARGHALALDERAAVIEADTVENDRNIVIDLWKKYLEIAF